MNRFILEVFYYFIFLIFVFRSVMDGISPYNKVVKELPLEVYVVAVYTTGSLFRDLRHMVQITTGRKVISRFKFVITLLADVIFLLSIGIKVGKPFLDRFSKL